MRRTCPKCVAPFYSLRSKGVHLRYAYTDGLLTVFTDARGQTWRYTYDDEGCLTAILAPKGHPAVRLRYNDAARVVEQLVSATARRTFAYDDAAHVHVLTDANGHTTAYEYNLSRVRQELSSCTLQKGGQGQNPARSSSG